MVNVRSRSNTMGSRYFNETSMHLSMPPVKAREIFQQEVQ
jgi:hypothetical protein